MSDLLIAPRCYLIITDMIAPRSYLKFLPSLGLKYSFLAIVENIWSSEKEIQRQWRYAGVFLCYDALLNCSKTVE